MVVKEKEQTMLRVCINTYQAIEAIDAIEAIEAIEAIDVTEVSPCT
jgi:hypothetical protein